MTLDEIHKNKPEGATHYTKLNFINGVEYFKVYNKYSIYVWDGMWHKLVIDQCSYILSMAKPLY